MNIFKRLMMPKALRKNKEIIYCETIGDGIYFTVSEDVNCKKRNVIYAIDKHANTYIGFLEIGHVNFIEKVFVRHKYRRKGHATNLIKHAVKLSYVDKVYVDNDDEIAISLFKKIGFKENENFNTSVMGMVYLTCDLSDINI